MSISALQAKTEYDYAKVLGWLEYFEASAKKYQLEISLLLAIASRETNIRNILGDYGHGAGVMQVDIGTDREFVTSGEWRDVAKSIDRGTAILSEKVNALAEAKWLSLEASQSIAIASYNCGRWALLDYRAGRDPDTHTTGHNYSKDVLSRQVLFKALSEKEFPHD